MKKSKETPETLMRQAKSLVMSETLDELRARTGIPSSWLRKFRRGEIKNPGVNRIEKILTSFGVSNVTL